MWLELHWPAATFFGVMTSFATRVAIFVPFRSLIRLFVVQYAAEKPDRGRFLGSIKIEAYPLTTHTKLNAHQMS